MKLFAMGIFLTLFSVVTHADPVLTRVQKDKCLLMPEVPAAEDMVKGVQYTIDLERNTLCDGFSGQCSLKLHVKTKYRYTVVTNYDHFNYAGQLVSSSVDRQAVILEKLTVSHSAGFTFDNQMQVYAETPEAQRRLQEILTSLSSRIEQEVGSVLLESADPACSNSYYHY